MLFALPLPYNILRGHMASTVPADSHTIEIEGIGANFYLHKAALKGDLEETKHLLGDGDPRLRLRKPVTNWEDQPDLAVTRDVHNDTALHVLARKPSSIFAHNIIGILKSLTYSS
ncbi:hypothetical protein JRO89_XS03G0194200 [Xanthoceras sorbifolium]|uniref:Uncharacterized protein n=1 Tax=Xanthoceras sorbifolium TaxID=99658 RepID=A0ABQ8IAL4_9ROSI|nr:hypothetical protein JRO89_XS03G0194200 [Xanthoceras sorbifolium]